MEYKYEVSAKEAFKSLRQQIIDGASAGGSSQRARLLAFTFIRGRAYETAEKTTEAKNLCPTGKVTYYTNLAFYAAIEVHRAFGGKERLPPDELRKEIMQWMKSHWEQQEIVPQVQQVSP